MTGPRSLDAVIAFDTPSDKRRRKLTTLLNRSGRRVQKSVFRVQGNARQLAALWEALERLCLPDEDALLICHVNPGALRQFGRMPDAMIEETIVL